MGVRALTSTAQQLPVGGRWVFEVEVTDDDCYVVDAAPIITVTLPNGSTSTPTVETLSTGLYRAAHDLAVSGRHIAVAVAAGYGQADWAVYATGTTNSAAMPTTDDVSDYMGTGAASWTEPELQGALDAEAAAQRSVCRVGAVYPADLREALLRRVVRNLALRGLPLAVLRGDAEGGDTILPGRDPEIRRLEAPHKKLFAL